MPRLARVVVPECPHHVTQRGNARPDVFYTPGDRQVYLRLLQQYSEHYSLRILGYCLMSNHVHLVVVPANVYSLPCTLREVHGRYARYRNAVEHTSGHVWQNRYYCCAFEAVRLASVMRYVELNPVRAGLVRAAEDYAWSSALMHLGGSDGLGLLDRTGWEREWTVEEWAGWLRDGTDEFAEVREATHRGRPWGGQAFVTDLEARMGRKLAPGRAGRPRKECSVAAG
jgi:REP-associated tyrosine transposase